MENPEDSGPSESQSISEVPPTFIERHGISPVLFAYLCVIAIFLLYQVAGAVITIILFGLEPQAENIQSFRLFTGIAQLLFLLVPAVFLARLTSDDPPGFLRVQRVRPGAVIAALVGILSLQQMLEIYMVFQARIPVPEAIREDLVRFKEMIDQAYRLLLAADTPGELIFIILIVAVIPAVCEEFVFRGLIQRSFEAGLGAARGILVTGMIFGAFHLNPFNIVPLIALGIYLGYIAYRADSIWVSVSAHFFNNLLAVGTLYISKDENAMLTGDPDSMPLGALMITFWLSGVIFLLSTYYFIHITRRQAPASLAD